MIDIFKPRITDRLTREKYELSPEIPKLNRAAFRTRSLRSYSPKRWNALPYHKKTLENLNSFKSIIKSWCGNHIRLQHNRLSQNIIVKYLILYEIQSEMKTLRE